MSLLFWQGSGILYNICYKLPEVFGILGSDYRLPCRFFNIFPGISCNGPAFLCYFSIFRKSSGLYSFRDFCCGGFRKHCQNQFQIVHVVSKIFFLQASHALNGSAFGDGTDWTIRKSCSVLATSVLYFFPSEDSIFSCTIFSYNSTAPSFFSFRFKSLQYRRGFSVPVKIAITSTMEKSTSGIVHL